MINMIKDLRSLQTTDRILLDTNVCLILFGPVQYKYEDPVRFRKYDNSQRNMGAGNVHICSPVLSEFVNKCRDFYWKQWIKDESPPKDKRAKKDFRDSTYYKNNQIGNKIAQYVEDMLCSVECCSSDFNKTKSYTFLDEFKKGKMDFNDTIIEEICIVNTLTLVTDDGDFKNSSIDIFTANI